MADIGWLCLAIAAAYGVAVVAGLTSFRRGPIAGVAVAGASVAVLAAPLLIPADKIVYRALSAYVSTDLFFRLVDFRREVCKKSERPSLPDFFGFLVPFPVLLVVYRARCQRWENARFAWGDLVRVVVGVAGVTSGFVLVDVTAGIAALRESFLLDHVAKVAIFVLTIETASQGLFGLERMTGFDAPPIVRTAFLSRTVAEFWMRYNTRVHRWLYENVFLPSGGRHAPMRGILLVFFVSAVLHELMFGIATSRFDGYQFAFFFMQAPAVLASGVVERLANRGGWVGAALARVLAIGWMTGSSVFFFHGVNRVFPFVYVSESWLP
jgi:hypothetical protein